MRYHYYIDGKILMLGGLEGEPPIAIEGDWDIDLMAAVLAPYQTELDLDLTKIVRVPTTVRVLL